MFLYFTYRKRATVPGTMIARRAQGIVIDSSWTPFSMKCSLKLTTGQQISLQRSNIVKIAVSGESRFSRIAFELVRTTKSKNTSSCFSRCIGSKHMLFDPERSRSKFDYRSRSRSDRIMPCCISLDAFWWDKHNEAIPNILSRFNQKLFANPVRSLKWPLTTFQEAIGKKRTLVITVGRKHHNFKRFGLFLCAHTDPEAFSFLSFDL